MDTSWQVDVGAAAATVEDILAVGGHLSREPGACPYGPTADLALLLPQQADMSPALRAGDVDDDGQFFFGDPEIVFCPISATDASSDQAGMDEFRVDVAFGAVDVTAYLDQNFETVDASDLLRRPEMFGGETVAVCHFDGCTGAWQLDDLFLAVTLIDGTEPSATVDDVTAALEQIVPVVVGRLTTLGKQREELTALAQSYWSDDYDDAMWDRWDQMILSGIVGAYQPWIDAEVESGTITNAQGEELVERLNALPGERLPY